MGGDDSDGLGKPTSKGKKLKEDLLARARDARKREARAQDKRKEEWQAATKSTNLMGVLGASNFGLAQAGELSGSILTEISATRDKAMARVQQMSQATDAPKALSAMAKEHFSGASKQTKSEQSKVDEHYRRLRTLAKFTLLALVVFFILSGVRSAYHDALSLVSPAAKELDRIKEETKTPFVVESYDSALSIENAENAENTEETATSLSALESSLELQSIHTRAGKTVFPSQEPPTVTGTLQEEMALAGVSFGAHATAPVGVETAEPDTQLLDQMPVMAEHLTGITGVTEDASPPGEAADLAGEPVAGEAEDGKKASRKFREKKGSKGKGSANDDAADVAEEVKELKQEEAEKEEEEKEKFDEAQARGQDDVASVQARSARSWTQQTITKQLESLGMKMLVLGEGMPLPAAENTQPPEFTVQSLKPSATWSERPSVLTNNMVAPNSKKLAYAHMATITRMPTAAPWRYMTAWQAGEWVEGAHGQHFRSSFSDDGEKWTTSVVIPVARNDKKALWAPVLFTHFDHVYLFFVESVSCLRPAGDGKPERWAPGGDIRMTRSKDGVTWSLPVTIYTQATKGGVPKLISNPPEIVNDKFVLPFWREKPPTKCSCKFGSRDFTAAGVLISGEGGAGPWKPYGELHDSKSYMIEGAAALKADGNLLQVFRTKSGKMYQSLSMDNGLTWTAGRSAGLPNPGSKVNTLRLSTGEIALAYNNNADARNKLTVALSGDGSHWYNIAEIEGTTTGYMYGYPTMAQDGDRLLVSYSVILKTKDIEVSKGGIRVAIVQLPRPSAKIKQEEEMEVLASPKRKQQAHERSAKRGNKDDGGSKADVSSKRGARTSSSSSRKHGR